MEILIRYGNCIAKNPKLGFMTNFVLMLATYVVLISWQSYWLGRLLGKW